MRMPWKEKRSRSSTLNSLASMRGWPKNVLPLGFLWFASVHAYFPMLPPGVEPVTGTAGIGLPVWALIRC
jgi:hypothetical protein